MSTLSLTTIMGGNHSQSQYRPHYSHHQSTYYTTTWGPRSHTPSHFGHGCNHRHIRPAFNFSIPPPHLRKRC